MGLVPRIAKMGLVGLALAGPAMPAFAGGLMPGNGGNIVLPTVLPPSVQALLLPPATSGVSSGFDVLGQKFGVRNGALDFFSVRPSEGGEFKPLFRGGVGEGGLKLQLKW